MERRHWARSPTAVALYLLALVAGLGLSRLLLEEPPRAALSQAAALQLARCFAPAEIAVNTGLTLRPLAAAGQAAEPPTLTILAKGPLKLAVAGADLPAQSQSISLKNRTVRFGKAGGEVEFMLAGMALARLRNGVDFLLAPDEGARFGPVDDASYAFSISADVPADLLVADGVRSVTVRAGTSLGAVPLVASQALATLQPLNALYWAADTPPTLMPIRVSGRPGLADVSIEVNRSGIDFSVPAASLAACALSEHAGAPVWMRAGVAQTSPGAPGSASILVVLPAGVLPAGQFRTPVRLALVSSDGRYVGLGGFNAIGRLYAALGATLLTGLMFGALTYFRGQRVKGADDAPRWFAGLFIGPDGDPSLSLLQVLVWTLVTIWGLLYVFIVAGKLLTLTAEMMGLLGIAGTGSVLARWIAVAGGGSTSRPAGGGARPVAAPASDFWRLLSTNGDFDLLKLQSFAFTMVIALYVVWRIADAGAFPELDANTLLLLGISQGVYITGKLAGGRKA